MLPSPISHPIPTPPPAASQARHPSPPACHAKFPSGYLTLGSLLSATPFSLFLLSPYIFPSSAFPCFLFHFHPSYAFLLLPPFIPPPPILYPPLYSPVPPSFPLCLSLFSSCLIRKRGMRRLGRDDGNVDDKIRLSEKERMWKIRCERE